MKSTHKKTKRPFRIWDGEGRNNDANGNPFPDGHRLILLANSDGHYIENADGLKTRDCVHFLLRPRPRAYDLWFSFGYDVNKIVQALPLFGNRGSLECLWNRNRAWFHGLFIKYIPRKFFTLRYNNEKFNSTDCFSFFQKSFLAACKEWALDATAIIEGKENRGNFDRWSLDQIREYNFAEMALCKELMERLRESFERVDLVPQSWHGPGAIATRWLQRESISVHYKQNVPGMVPSIRRAFFGGRIDTAIIGEVEASQHDLASAYPMGLTDCISLAGIEWEHKDDCPIDRHALYHVRWYVPYDSVWNPFPWRTKNGGVLYPFEGEGWYWGIEVIQALRLFPSCIEILEGWFPYGERIFPFKQAIERDYENRAVLKREKNPAHMAVRLGLNSLYGKLCQHVSGVPGKPPRWQNYIWAGYTTAYTRARILEAIRIVGDDNVIAIATDGIFTRVPLLTEPPKLGAWEDKGKYPTLFIAAGLYAIFKDDETTTVKQRGMPANINYGWILRQWGCDTDRNCEGVNAFSSTFQSFIGMGKALHQDKPHGVFVTEERFVHTIPVVGTSKRYPHPEWIDRRGWKEYPLLPRKRTEPVISYPYERRQEYDPLEEKE